jgi:hypothetical protein
MTATLTQAGITSAQALAVAEADAVRAYGDLSPFQIRVRLEGDGWHVEYSLKDPGVNGGGPHYVIDATTGEIAAKKYYQ